MPTPDLLAVPDGINSYLVNPWEFNTSTYRLFSYRAFLFDRKDWKQGVYLITPQSQWEAPKNIEGDRHPFLYDPSYISNTFLFNRKPRFSINYDTGITNDTAAKNHEIYRLRLQQYELALDDYNDIVNDCNTIIDQLTNIETSINADLHASEDPYVIPHPYNTSKQYVTTLTSFVAALESRKVELETAIASHQSALVGGATPTIFAVNQTITSNGIPHAPYNLCQIAHKRTGLTYPLYLTLTAPSVITIPDYRFTEEAVRSLLISTSPTIKLDVHGAVYQLGYQGNPLISNVNFTMKGNPYDRHWNQSAWHLLQQFWPNRVSPYILPNKPLTTNDDIPINDVHDYVGQGEAVTLYIGRSIKDYTYRTDIVSRTGIRDDDNHYLRTEQDFDFYYPTTASSQELNYGFTQNADTDYYSDRSDPIFVVTGPGTSRLASDFHVERYLSNDKSFNQDRIASNIDYPIPIAGPTQESDYLGIPDLKDASLSPIPYEAEVFSNHHVPEFHPPSDTLPANDPPEGLIYTHLTEGTDQSPSSYSINESDSFTYTPSPPGNRDYVFNSATFDHEVSVEQIYTNYPDIKSFTYRDNEGMFRIGVTFIYKIEWSTIIDIDLNVNNLSYAGSQDWDYIYQYEIQSTDYVYLKLNRPGQLDPFPTTLFDPKYLRYQTYRKELLTLDTGTPPLTTYLNSEVSNPTLPNDQDIIDAILDDDPVSAITAPTSESPQAHHRIRDGQSITVPASADYKIFARKNVTWTDILKLSLPAPPTVNLNFTKNYLRYGHRLATAPTFQQDFLKLQSAGQTIFNLPE